MAAPLATMLTIEDEPDRLLARFRRYQPPARKWSSDSSPRVSAVMHSSQGDPVAASTPIRIAAAVIADQDGRILLVRKRATPFFMQPGGKLHDGETPSETLARELDEELGCTLIQAEFVGTFSAPAANEPSHTVEALLFCAKITPDVEPAAEIEEIAWVEPSRTGNLPLAPLTRDHVLPLVLSRRSQSAF